MTCCWDGDPCRMFCGERRGEARNRPFSNSARWSTGRMSRGSVVNGVHVNYPVVPAISIAWREIRPIRLVVFVSSCSNGNLWRGTALLGQRQRQLPTDRMAVNASLWHKVEHIMAEAIASAATTPTPAASLPAPPNPAAPALGSLQVIPKSFAVGRWAILNNTRVSSGLSWVVIPHRIGHVVVG